MGQAEWNSDFKSAFVKESEMIQSAVKRYGTEVLLEDKSFDLIAAIVYNKITNFTREDDYSTKESERLTFRELLTFMVTAVSVIYMLVVICGWFGVESFNNHSFGGGFWKNRGDQGSIMVGEFEFKSGDQIGTSSFFGKEKLFKLWEERILTSIRAIATKPKSVLDKLSIYQKLNFVLFGPPGTGKTLFVQALATRIDFELKKMHLSESEPSKYGEMLGKSRSEFRKYIDKTPSRIRFCEVQPGMINSKYIGVAEKNVKSLFESAKKTLINQKWKITILFFDEGDVFFDKRRSGSTASGDAAVKVKSELLTRIGVRPTEEYLPLFVFTASNRMEEFDDAFKRRFANQEEFGFPSVEERKRFVRFLLDGFDITEAEVALIAAYTERKSYSYISEKMRLFMVADDNDEFTQIEFGKYMEFLKRNRSNRNMI